MWQVSHQILIAALISALLVAGYSKKEENSPPDKATVTAADLGKDANYFSNLYGPAKSQKQVSEFDFTLPTVGHLVKLTGPFVTQQYTSDKLIDISHMISSPRPAWTFYGDFL
jgi:hypothetical protein